jgi:GT2 family glycosyltransferase
VREAAGAGDPSSDLAGSTIGSMERPPERTAAVIIPNWNGRDLLAANLPSILKACGEAETPCEVVVVDDGSDDNSVELLWTHFPEVRVIRHEENRGFGRACMSGAQATPVEALIFLNSDVQVAPGFLAPLLVTIQQEECFAATPIFLAPDGVVLGSSLRVPYLRRGQIRYRRTDTNVLVSPAKRRGPWYTLCPDGAAFAVRRDRFLELGGFDELFEPFYYEDVDLGIRAWRRGWSCQVAPESRVWHQGRRSIERRFSRLYIRAVRKRNRMLCLTKNLTTRSQLFAHLVFQLQRDLLSLLRLDVLPLVGSVLAIWRFRWALDRRREELTQGGLTIDGILSTIERAWQSNTQPRADVEPLAKTAS